MRRLLMLLAALLLLSGCARTAQTQGAYTQLTQAEAQAWMEREDGHIIVDVRRQDEYDAGHIPGAMLIPNESITDTPPQALPDKNQVILIYCRRGNRSKDAAQKLADMGYTQVYEFGGVETWPGELVTAEGPQVWTAQETPVRVRYDRYWEYSASAESDDPAVIAALVEAIRAIELGGTTEWATEDYTDFVTFTFADGSTQRFEFEDQCWVSEDHVRYLAEGLGPVRQILNEMMED